ncbi:MAG: hypothetical protein MUF60_06615 [Vicinamibacterales bacterium]|nr:hypothetical protein [Vicinamibacterales bacterium]
MPVPDIRIRCLNARPERGERDFVLYWMTAFRRTRWNFALERAVEHARRLGKPLVVLEALRAAYPWASDRLHAFVIGGMRDNAASLAATGVRYVPYLEPTPGAGRGLLEALAERAAVVVTDDFPAFFLRRMAAAAATRLDVRLEAVDANGLLPLRASSRAYPTAFAFRAFVQKHLREHLEGFPLEDSLAGADLVAAPAGLLPPAVAHRWPSAPVDPSPEALARLPIDHAITVVRETPGGARAASRVLAAFLDTKLARYKDERNQPELDVASGLSPYLHFGHVSVHEVFHALMTREGWTTRRIAPKGGGQREGWWGASPAAESYLDELITWREVGFHTCEHRPDDYDKYESLPDWARATLDRHAADPRAHAYSLEQFEQAATHDPLWNAAQRQLVREGRIHNYLRMLWGKKILEWSASPREALAVMIELNNKYALDGRDPNSYSGIFWVLGRYDRPWAPERPVFGVVRYMSSENTARKVRVKDYVRRYAPDTRTAGLFG